MIIQLHIQVAKGLIFFYYYIIQELFQKMSQQYQLKTKAVIKQYMDAFSLVPQLNASNLYSTLNVKGMQITLGQELKPDVDILKQFDVQVLKQQRQNAWNARDLLLHRLSNQVKAEFACPAQEYGTYAYIRKMLARKPILELYLFHMKTKVQNQVKNFAYFLLKLSEQLQTLDQIEFNNIIRKINNSSKNITLDYSETKVVFGGGMSKRLEYFSANEPRENCIFEKHKDQINTTEKFVSIPLNSSAEIEKLMQAKIKQQSRNMSGSFFKKQCLAIPYIRISEFYKSIEYSKEKNQNGEYSKKSICFVVDLAPNVVADFGLKKTKSNFLIVTQPDVSKMIVNFDQLAGDPASKKYTLDYIASKIVDNQRRQGQGGAKKGLNKHNGQSMPMNQKILTENELAYTKHGRTYYFVPSARVNQICDIKSKGKKELHAMPAIERAKDDATTEALYGLLLKIKTELVDEIQIEEDDEKNRVEIVLSKIKDDPVYKKFEKASSKSIYSKVQDTHWQLDDILRSDIKDAEFSLVESGFNHCNLVSLNCLLGIRFLDSIQGYFQWQYKTDTQSMNKHTCDFLNDLGFKIIENRPMFPIVVGETQAFIWLEFRKKVVDDASKLCQILATPLDFNCYLSERFPIRLLVQIDRLPLNNSYYAHTSHILNLKFDFLSDCWLIRDNVGGWYRSLTKTENSTKYLNSNFYNTFANIHKMTFWYLAESSQQPSRTFKSIVDQLAQSKPSDKVDFSEAINRKRGRPKNQAVQQVVLSTQKNKPILQKQFKQQNEKVQEKQPDLQQNVPKQDKSNSIVLDNELGQFEAYIKEQNKYTEMVTQKSILEEDFENELIQARAYQKMIEEMASKNADLMKHPKYPDPMNVMSVLSKFNAKATEDFVDKKGVQDKKRFNKFMRKQDDAVTKMTAKLKAQSQQNFGSDNQKEGNNVVSQQKKVQKRANSKNFQSNSQSALSVTNNLKKPPKNTQKQTNEKTNSAKAKTSSNKGPPAKVQESFLDSKTQSKQSQKLAAESSYVELRNNNSVAPNTSDKQSKQSITAPNLIQ